ncbi:MAG: CPBP family intramembrane metalloprotease, partial [Clostridia bacterium]|nr:CPBP family intramembrane metalloprotease [Clostridia bacterium]
MYKLYRRNAVTFAILWIAAYCLILTPIRAQVESGSPLMLAVLAAFAAAITAFVIRHHLTGELGLGHWPGDTRQCLYFIPMWLLATGNLWGGIHPAHGLPDQLYACLSMVMVGYVEEMIFRGFLFGAMYRSGSVRRAVCVSALTFGIGHIVNLFAGLATLATAVQMIFAILWGFILTLNYLKSGSLWPSILAHALIDLFAEFASPNEQTSWIYIGV